MTSLILTKWMPSQTMGAEEYKIENENKMRAEVLELYETGSHIIGWHPYPTSLFTQSSRLWEARRAREQFVVIEPSTVQIGWTHN